MTEFILFAVVGAIAVVAAVMMLLSSNAVHAALYLVATMICIAFLFLLLNAPFLAMIQITVYAGAIMVLFLFVIMLLGSEQGEQQTSGDSPQRRFRWFVPLALVLALSLLFAIGLTVTTATQDDSSFQSPPAGNAQLRLVNASLDAGAIRLQSGEEVLFGNVAFGEGTDYIEVPPGDVEISIVPENGEPLVQPFSLAADSVGTVVVYSGDNGLNAGFVAESLDTVAENRSGRVVIFNAYPAADAVSVVDYGSEFVEDDTQVLVDGLALGTATAPIAIEEGETDWSFADATDSTVQIQPVIGHEIERNTSNLLILTQEQSPEGIGAAAVRPATVQISVPARPSFGGPQAIGYALFTDFLLPFQLLALLLLAAMVGVIVLTHRHLTPSATRPGVRRRVSRPLVNVIAAQVGHDVTETGAERLPADEAEVVGN
ncbi:MAG: NADH-quinone oxidoreductase subunit J [Chloroflexi bacterium]|nr:NADH-quinone oxidoreductase subunit J [Chloroflexota bacterium]